MSDKVRGAIFNMLGNIDGLTVLDAFAGSGAISYEAVSRGAAHATLIELDKRAFRTMKENIGSLGIEDRVAAIQGNIKGWSNNHTESTFDIVICDPPYDAVLEQLIHKVSRHVAPEGVLVLSWPNKEPIPGIPGMKLVRHKNYGDANLYVYQRTLAISGS